MLPIWKKLVVVNIPNPTGRSADNLSLSRYQSFSVLDNRDLSFSKSVNLKWERAVQGPNWVPIPWKIGIPFWSLSPWSEVPWWIGSSAVTTRCLNYNISEKKPWFSCSVCKGTRTERKTGLCGKNSQAADPPHPPSLGNPCYQKKKLGLFFILGPQEHFWSSPKITILGDKLKLCCGNRWPPPSATPVFSIFSKKKTSLSVQIDQISPPPFL